MKVLLKAWSDNDLTAIAVALGITLGALLAIALARFVAARVLGALARRTTTQLDDILAQAVAATKIWLLLPVALRFGAHVLDLPPNLERAADKFALVAIVLQAALWGSYMVRAWIKRKVAAGGTTDGDTMTALGLLGFSARLVVWTIALLTILDVMGFNVTALLTGLGVGGIAVALAVQNILGDLFASLSIVLDKPFVVGDFIIVDDLFGTVERVGIKTTRVRSLNGELLVFSNSDLLKSRIRNYRQMAQRRIVFQVGVTYETASEKVHAISGMLREIVESQEKVRFDRAHFKQFGDSALVFEVVYYVLDGDYATYVAIEQKINLAIFDRFAAEGISIAYPTRTLHLVTSTPAEAS